MRKIILNLQEQNGRYEMPEIDGFDPHVIGHHVYLMDEAGLLKSMPIDSMEHPFRICIPTSITWEGHNFADAIRDESFWNQAKAKAKDAFFALGIAGMTAYLKHLAKVHFGIEIE